MPFAKDTHNVQDDAHSNNANTSQDKEDSMQNVEQIGDKTEFYSMQAEANTSIPSQDVTESVIGSQTKEGSSSVQAELNSTTSWLPCRR